MKGLVVLALFVSTLAAGQTLSPPNSECAVKKCVGSFTITNDMLQPMAVTIKPVSFSLTGDGKATFRDLDSTVDVSLSTMSARLSPKELFIVDYKIKCSTSPCLVDFAAGMMPIQHKDTSGASIRIILNHIIYACDKAKNCRVNTLKSVGYLK